MANAKGKITGTGAAALSEISGVKFDLRLDFEGTATVDLEEKVAGSSAATWIKIETGIAADYRKVFESITTTTLRLNCTAYTNPVAFDLASV